MNGRILKRIRLNIDIKKTPKDKIKIWLNERFSKSQIKRFTFSDYIQPVSKVIPLEKGFVALRRNGYGTECLEPVYGEYFDYDLNLIGKVQFPCFDRINANIRGLSRITIKYISGYLYLLKEANEEYILEKWKVIE